MRELTARHKKIFREIEIERFINETVADMIELDVNNPYPPNKEEYEIFVKAGISEAAKYGLETEQHVFALILTWHVLGKKLGKNKELMDALNEEYIQPEEKCDILFDLITEEIDRQEESHAGD